MQLPVRFQKFREDFFVLEVHFEFFLTPLELVGNQVFRDESKGK